MTCPSSDRRLAVATTGFLLLLLAWEATGMDLRLAHFSGSASGFALREHWFLEGWLHQGGRLAGWTASLALCAAVWWPVGWLKQLDMNERLRLAVIPLISALAVVTFKGLSAASCPWDLTDFGGVARYVSHWHGFIASDGGSGHCFPAGQASSGFCFVGGYFVLHPRMPRIGWAWLAASVTVGFALGIAQQLRGAHFMSHTLWTGALCWMVGWAVNRAWPAARPVAHGVSFE